MSLHHCRLIASLPLLLLAPSLAVAHQGHPYAGLTHGAEMPAGASGLTYGSGFVPATATLHAIGIGPGNMLERPDSVRLPRVAGAVIASIGLILAVMRVAG